MIHLGGIVRLDLITIRAVLIKEVAGHVSERRVLLCWGDSDSVSEDADSQEFAFSRVAYRRVGPAGIEGVHQFPPFSASRTPVR